MNVFFKQLKKDHHVVKGILEKIDDTTPRLATRRHELIQKLKEEIVPHARAEEKVLYGKMLEEDRELEVAALEGHVEHKIVDVLIPELLELDATTPLWQAKFAVLKEAIEHHIKEEEKEFFKKAESKMDVDFDELLEEFNSLKAELSETLPSQEDYKTTAEDVASVQ